MLRSTWILSTIVAGCIARSVAGQAAVSSKTAGDLFKNVQVLKDVPVSDWVPTMQFISGSLGVSCEFCHTIVKFESDTKDTKVRAREMIRMVQTINATSFSGRVAVTCNTCHRGNVASSPVPAPWNKTAEELAAYKRELQIVEERERIAGGQPPAEPPAARAPQMTPQSTLPPASQVVAQYREAVGEQFMSRWKTLRVALTGVVDASSASTSVTIYYAGPDKVLLGDSVPGPRPRIVLSGDRAWAVTPQSRTMLPPEQLETVKQRARLFAPVKLEGSPELRNIGIERIGDRDYYVLEMRAPKFLRRAFIDVVSHLLSRVREETATPLGTMVTEMVFSDYRQLGGLKLPWTITASYMENRIVYTLADVRGDAAIDMSLFEPPN